MLSFVALVAGDVYMQYPPGSNNRLNEGGGNNNNRLMDTQNNAKGGYGYTASNNNRQTNADGSTTDQVKYMAGSLTSMSWTSQHSCGSTNAECQTVIQYMCNDGTGMPLGVPADINGAAATGAGQGPLRDGQNNG